MPVNDSLNPKNIQNDIINFETSADHKTSANTLVLLDD